MTSETFNELRQSALNNYWFPSQQWNDMAEEGGMCIITEGQGVKVKDTEGKWYYDAGAGQMLVNAGHGRQEIVEAVQEQLSTLHYAATMSITPNAPIIRLAEKVASLTPGDLNRVYFTSSGSEAVDTALRIARQYHVNRGEPQRTKFIARKGSYHGVSLGALSVNGTPFVKRGIFEPLMGPVFFVPQPLPYRCEFGASSPSECAIQCAQAVEEIILREGAETVAAVIAEPVSASAGVAIPGDEYWPSLRRICDEFGVLLIADEVVTGFGRTGKWFAMEHWDVVPDMMTVAKGITSGYQPVGACIARDHVYEAFKGGPEVTFSQGFTYGGHPAGGAAGLANIKIMEREGLVEHSATMGNYLLDRLTTLKEHPTVGDVRGLGLLCAVDLVKDKDTKEPIGSIPGAERLLRDKLLELGMIARTNGGVFFTPPLTVTKEDLDQMVDMADEAIGYMEQILGRG